MAQLLYTTYISVDLAHHEIYPAEEGRDGINQNLLLYTSYKPNSIILAIPGT